MTPTAKLRFLERVEGFEQYDVKVTERHGTEVCYRPKKTRTLQQWWEPEQNIIDMVAGKTKGEWRDVPLEQEQA